MKEDLENKKNNFAKENSYSDPEKKAEDLSKEEKLERLILEKDYAFDKEQGLRIKITFLVLSVCIYLLALFIGVELKIIDMSYCLWFIVIAPLMAGFLMFISWGILDYIISGAMKRVETIAKLEGELNAIKFNKYDKKI